jgi:hypothetical protein
MTASTSELDQIITTTKTILSSRLLNSAASRALVRASKLRVYKAGDYISNTDTFDLIFLAILAGSDPLSLWVQLYANGYGI